MSFAHSTFCVFLYIYIYFFFGIAATWQPVYTFLSCTFLLNLIFKLQYTVMHIFIFYILFFITYSLLISFSLYLYLCIFPLCLYSIIFALSMELTWLTFHCWLYILYIIVYVTNKNLESWILNSCSQPVLIYLFGYYFIQCILLVNIWIICWTFGFLQAWLNVLDVCL